MSPEEAAHTNSTPDSSNTSTPLIWLAGVVFVVSVAALLALELSGRPTLTLVALVTPVITGLLVSGHVSTVTRQQNVAINKIERQTNGVLDDRIRTQVIAALVEAGPMPATVVAHATVTPVTDDEEPSPAGEPPSASTMPAAFLDTAQRVPQ